MKRIIASWLLAVLSSSWAFAEDREGLSLLSFRLSQHSMVQKGGNFFTGNLNWTPRYQFSSDWGIRLNLGGSYTKSLAGEVSPLLDALTYVGWGGENFVLELGGGLQYFSGNGGSRLAWGGTAVFPVSLLGVFDHFFAGYLAAMVPQRTLHETKVGVGIGF